MGVSYAEKTDRRALGPIVNDMLKFQTLPFKQKSEPGNYTVRAVSQEGKTYSMKVLLREDRSSSWNFPVEKRRRPKPLRNSLEKLASELRPGMDYKFELRQAYALSAQWEQMKINMVTKAPVLPANIAAGMYRVRAIGGIGPQIRNEKEYEVSIGPNGKVDFYHEVKPQRNLFDVPKPGIQRIPGMPE